MVGKCRTDGRVGLRDATAGSQTPRRRHSHRSALATDERALRENGLVTDEPRQDERVAGVRPGLDGELADLRKQVAHLRAENARLLRLLELTPTQARVRGPVQTGIFDAAPGAVDAASPAVAKVAFFAALFGARTDVHAVRWESTRTGKSGWMPAVRGGWRRGVRPEQGEYRPLTEDVLTAHLSGEIEVGLYPLLDGDRCWWLAADFDGPAAMLDALAYLKARARRVRQSHWRCHTPGPVRMHGCSSLRPFRRRSHDERAVGTSLGLPRRHIQAFSTRTCGPSRLSRSARLNHAASHTNVRSIGLDGLLSAGRSARTARQQGARGAQEPRLAPLATKTLPDDLVSGSKPARRGGAERPRTLDPHTASSGRPCAHRLRARTSTASVAQSRA